MKASQKARIDCCAQTKGLTAHDERHKILDETPTVKAWQKLLVDMEKRLRAAMPEQIKSSIKFSISDKNQISASVSGIGKSEANITLDKKLLTEAKQKVKLLQLSFMK